MTTLKDIAAGLDNQQKNKNTISEDVLVRSDEKQNQILPKENTIDYMPLAFDADDDISSFDPFAPKVNIPRPEQSKASSLPRMNTVDLLSDFDNISQEQEQSDTPQVNPDSSRNDSHDNRKSKEIDALRQNQLNMSSASSPPQDSKLTAAMTENGRASPAFDVVDGAEVENLPFPAIGTRVSQVMKARENVVRLHMAARETEFTEKFPFTVFVGTWNVNGQVAGECLKPWLDAGTDPPDIVAVGFQELDLSAEALVFNDSSREESWLKAIEKGLPESAVYTQVRTVRLVGMMLTVYVQTKHMAHIRDLASETCGTGIMGKMGNKGGVSVRFQFHNSSICFVNSHLAAHLAEFERRNQDFKEISSRLQFSKFEPPMVITHHDVVFWLGDLNYRFDDLEADQVKALIESHKLDELLRFDQLKKQMSAGKVFHGYSEGKLSFKPTYKFDPGTDEWDTSEKNRAPAWCDRILWRGKSIEQTVYQSHTALKLSDHKPVSAMFNTGIKIVNKRKERHVFEEIMLKLDRVENDNLPQVKLGKTEFHFDNVQFMEDQVDILPIANIGQVPVEFQFIPKLDDIEIAKPWLNIQPRSGVIMPGDVQEIEITVLVEKEIVPTLFGDWKLDEILVLHLVDGKDFFVPINGVYTPSVFGSSLNSLVKMYGPIRMIPVDSLATLDNSSPTDIPGVGPEPLDIPKELWLLVDHLYRNGMREDNILIQPGLDAEIVNIRNYLDTGQKGTMPGSIFSVGEALLLFLKSLKEPVVPYKFQSKCMDACQNFVLCKQVVSQIPVTHINVFKYITAFLRELLKYTLENKLDAKILATIFGGILLRPAKDQTNISRRMETQIGQKKARFVYHFLVNDFND